MKKTQVEYRCQDQKNKLSGSEMSAVSLQDERVHQQRKGQKDETYYRDQDIGVQNMEEVCEEPK
jgi:hypothetical protein